MKGMINRILKGISLSFIVLSFLPRFIAIYFPVSIICSQFTSVIVAITRERNNVIFVFFLFVSIFSNWYLGSLNYNESMTSYCNSYSWNRESLSKWSQNNTSIQIDHNNEVGCRFVLIFINILFWFNGFLQTLLLLHTLVSLAYMYTEQQTINLIGPTNLINSTFMFVFFFFNTIALYIVSRTLFVPLNNLSLFLFLAWFTPSGRVRSSKWIQFCLFFFCVVVSFQKEIPCSGTIEDGPLTITIHQKHQEQCHMVHFYLSTAKFLLCLLYLAQFISELTLIGK